MRISADFDGGNVECIEVADDRARLAIRRDHASEHMQWFYFRASGVRGRALSFVLENAAEASYPKGWEDYRAVASYDRERWFRVDSSFDGRALTISHTPEHDACFYAYFAPYSMERHHDLIARSQMAQGCRLEVLGQTLDGQDLDMLIIGEDDGAAGVAKKPCWIIARQHPGETMAEFLVEGLLERLLDDEDPVARELRKRATFYVVPNMNPDGSRRGHLRTNAAGANLNREWLEPTMERSPEVHLVLSRMRKSGVDFALDVHGDEGLPYNFIAGPDGVASVGPERRQLQVDYEAALVRASPDFQTEYGYPAPPTGKANMTMATNFLADTFGALSMTLEQPFKDTAPTPHVGLGWSPRRCMALGRANLDALWSIFERL